MTAAQLIMLAIQASIALVLFGLGLAATFADLTHVLRRPWLLLRSLLAMSVIMLLVALVLVNVMALPHAVAAALLTLALAPVPPLLPTKQVKAGGRSSYAIGLLVSASLLAIVWIPLALELIDPFFPADLSAPLPEMARLVVTMLLAPLAAGVLVRQLAPAFARRILLLVHKIAPLLLLVAAIPVLFTMWPQIMAQIGDGTLVALVAFAASGLLVGHLLGGPDTDDRTVLALASAGRHPGIAVALARMNAPEDHAVPAAVVLYLLVYALVTLPLRGMAQEKRGDGAHDFKLSAPLPNVAEIVAIARILQRKHCSRIAPPAPHGARLAHGNDGDQHKKHNANRDSEKAGGQHASYMGCPHAPRTSSRLKKQQGSAFYSAGASVLSGRAITCSMLAPTS